VSPDRGSTPTSPYSVPQIAPLPSSTLCPICKTSDLTSTPSQPNFNTCTQCHNKVCNQCGFNPNPHLTQVTTLCLDSSFTHCLITMSPWFSFTNSLPMVISLSHQHLMHLLVWWYPGSVMWYQRIRPGCRSLEGFLHLKSLGTVPE
jgi:hypothetical protein